MARSFGELFLARVGVGAGESALMPASNSLISDYFAPEHRARAMSIFLVGGSAGSAAAYFVSGFAIDMASALRDTGIPFLQPLRDWQIAFMVIGFPGVLVSLLMLLTVREPVRRERAAGSSLTLKALWRHMSAHRLAYAAIMVGGLMNGVMVAAQVAWFPSLFIRVHEWSPSRFGAIFGMISFPCGLFSALSAGWLLTWLAKRGRNDGPILIILGQTVVWGIFGTAKSLVPSPEWSMAFHVITNFCGIWSITASMTALSQITPNEMRGKAVAVYTLLTGLVAYTVGAASVGMMTDSLYRGPTGVGQGLATVYVACSLLAAAVLMVGAGAYRRSAQAARAWAN